MAHGAVRRLRETAAVVGVRAVLARDVRVADLTDREGQGAATLSGGGRGRALRPRPARAVVARHLAAGLLLPLARPTLGLRARLRGGAGRGLGARDGGGAGAREAAGSGLRGAEGRGRRVADGHEPSDLALLRLLLGREGRRRRGHRLLTRHQVGSGALRGSLLLQGHQREITAASRSRRRSAVTCVTAVVRSASPWMPPGPKALSTIAAHSPRPPLRSAPTW